jgi:hypothetical protein
VKKPNDAGSFKRIPPRSPVWPSTAPDKLKVLEGTKKKIGIIRLWPRQAAAEHESIERYRLAASLIGVEIVELDRLGFLLDGPRRQVTRADVDFVISLHFETPKAFDCFSWGAMWNPIDFYLDWGANTFLDHQFSHDGYFRCGSPQIERLCAIEMASKRSSPFVQVNHTLSGPLYAPVERTDRRLVYSGINWERLQRKNGRFDELLRPLDSAGILDVFGPEEVQGVRVWEGFDGYQYAVPFDGQSLIAELSISGGVLALSSNAHLRSGVMSSRLFEGAAAGALVFSDENPFVRRFFSNETVPIQVTGDAKRDAREIVAKLEYFNRNPAEALQIAQALQNKYTAGYLLHEQLLNVYAAHNKSVVATEQACVATKGKGKVAFVIFWLDPSDALPNALLDDIKNQSYDDTLVVIVTQRKIAGSRRPIGVDERENVQIRYVDDAYGDKKNAIGMFLCDVVEELPEDVKYINVSIGIERLFRDFTFRMVAAAEDKGGAICAALVRHYDPARRELLGEEFVDYWRPRAGVAMIEPSIANFLVTRETMSEMSGALQFFNFGGIRAMFATCLPRFGVVDSPLMTTDLKHYERAVRLHEQPYEADKFAQVLSKYARGSGSALNGADHLQVFQPQPVTIIGGQEVSAATITNMNLADKRAIIVDLIKSLPLPGWFVKTGGFFARLLMGKRGRPRPVK